MSIGGSGGERDAGQEEKKARIAPVCGEVAGQEEKKARIAPVCKERHPWRLETESVDAENWPGTTGKTSMKA